VRLFDVGPTSQEWSVVENKFATLYVIIHTIFTHDYDITGVWEIWRKYDITKWSTNLMKMSLYTCHAQMT